MVMHVANPAHLAFLAVLLWDGVKDDLANDTGHQLCPSIIKLLKDERDRIVTYSCNFV